jgi:ADP-ribose pyrophosphatase
MKTKLKKWKTISSKVVFRNKYIKVYHDVVRLPGGEKYNYYYKNKKGRAALVLPVDTKGRLMIAKEFRYPTGKIIYGAIAGSVDKGETPLQAAKREFREETGYIAKKFEPLGYFYGNPGRSGSTFHVFLARGIKKVGPPRFETAENVEIEFMSCNFFEKLVSQNEIVDPFLMSIYLLYKHRKK